MSVAVGHSSNATKPTDQTNLARGLCLPLLLLALDELNAVRHDLALFLGVTNSVLDGLDLGPLKLLGDRRIDEVEDGLHALAEADELLTHLLRGQGLQFGSLRDRALGSGERIGLKSNTAGGVVDADVELTLAAAIHDELFDRNGIVVVRRPKGKELDDEIHLHGGVDLRQLLQDASQNHLVERLDVLGELLVLGERVDDGSNLFANRQRVEVNFENVVELLDFGTHAAEDVAAEDLFEQGLAGRSASRPQQVGQTLGARLVVKLGVGLGRRDNGNRQDRDENDRREPRLLVLAQVFVLAHGGVVLVASGGVEQVVFANEEDLGKLLVVVGHHEGLGSLLGHGEEVVNVLDGTEGLLPELQVRGGIELHETGVQVALQGIRVAQVDGVGLVLVLGGGLQVRAKQVAQTTELGLALVLETELERLVGNHLGIKLKELCQQDAFQTILVDTN